MGGPCVTRSSSVLVKSSTKSRDTGSRNLPVPTRPRFVQWIGRCTRGTAKVSARVPIVPIVITVQVAGPE